MIHFLVVYGLKCSIVTRIFKKGSTGDFVNYRTVSHLPVISKTIGESTFISAKITYSKAV